MGIAPVIYKKNFLTESLKSIHAKLQSEFWIDLAKIFLMAKSPPWKYEKEMRIVAYKPQNLKIPNNFIKKITFGINASNDDIDLIKEITHRYNPNVKLYKASKGKSDFGFKFTEIV